MLLIALPVCGYRLYGTLVHPLRTDVQPVFLKLLVCYSRLKAPSLPLTLLSPLPEFGIIVESRPAACIFDKVCPIPSHAYKPPTFCVIG